MIDDVGERHVAVMRTGVVAPAQVHAHLLRRNVHERAVERLDVQLHRLAEPGEIEIRVLRVPAHREIRAVDLQHDAGVHDRFVLVAERFGHREHILFLVRVVVVAEEEGRHARRGGADEQPLRAGLFAASR